ncbi:hypothetical protein FACS1894198_3730 [Clostridia bacterium]|nr:hypothetical protein FACS1894198_3730 [Clostridia bacterium]
MVDSVRFLEVSVGELFEINGGALEGGAVVLPHGNAGGGNAAGNRGNNARGAHPLDHLYAPGPSPKELKRQQGAQRLAEQRYIRRCAAHIAGAKMGRKH